MRRVEVVNAEWKTSLSRPLLMALGCKMYLAVTKLSKRQYEAVVGMIFQIMQSCTNSPGIGS